MTSTDFRAPRNISCRAASSVSQTERARLRKAERMTIVLGKPAMRSSSRAWTVVVALVLTLLTTVSDVRGQQGGPNTQAFLVKDINDAFNTAADSSPGPFVEAGGAVFFSANDGAGVALWRTDGTAAGTVMVLNAGTDNLINVNGTLFFTFGSS